MEIESFRHTCTRRTKLVTPWALVGAKNLILNLLIFQYIFEWNIGGSILKIDQPNPLTFDNVNVWASSPTGDLPPANARIRGLKIDGGKREAFIKKKHFLWQKLCDICHKKFLAAKTQLNKS